MRLKIKPVSYFIFYEEARKIWAILAQITLFAELSPAFIMDPVAIWNLICASDSFSCYSFNCLSCQGLLQSPSNADMDYGHVSEAV